MIKPIGTNILVRLNHRKEVAGLLIPDKAKRWQESTLEAEVIAVGPHVASVEPGDIVIIEGHAGKWIDPGLAGDPTEIFRMITKPDILLVVDPEPKLEEAVS